MRTDKPYRVYRQRPRLRQGSGEIVWPDADNSRGNAGFNKRRRVPVKRIFKYTTILVFCTLLVGGVWGTVAYLSFSDAVKDRNAAVPDGVERQLAASDGPAFTTPMNILVVGSDSRGKDDAGRADSMIIVRADVKSRRIAMLSIPRDLLVPIDGLGEEKINSAFSNGGLPLTIKTIRQYTGARIHHVVHIDFQGFKKLIDSIDGIEVINEKRIQSNRFDGRVWHFKKGKLHLDGRRALAFARIRHNRLDPAESDLTRARRQQLVINAVIDKLVSVRTLKHPISVPKAAVQPLVTDMSASELMALAAAKTLASGDHNIHCRLGGEIDSFRGLSVIIGTEENRDVVNRWLGNQAPRKPNTAQNQFAPGCVAD